MAACELRTIQTAFGVDGRPRALDGGEGLTFLVGDLVLKRVHDPDETAWTQQLLSLVHQDGFRVPEPVRALDGTWLHDGWAASRFVDGLRPAAPDWPLIAEAGVRFADAMEEVRAGGADVLARRTHRWAIADRAAWGEQSVELGPEANDIYVRISALLGARPGESHFVHGDLTGNVHIDSRGVAVILDVSPYLRPRLWAVAIVTADAVLWHGADPPVAQTFASTSAQSDLLGRALIFRMVAEQFAERPRHGAPLEPYVRVLSTLA